MERNDENTIGARIEKMLMDATDAADATTTRAVDEKDPARRMAVLMEGYRMAVQALLPNEDLERLHLAEKCGEPTFHTPPAISDFVLGNPPLAGIPGGADGTMPGPDPAEETVARKSVYGILEERHGLALKRFACSHSVRTVGVRRCSEGRDDQIWDIAVDKTCKRSSVSCNGEWLFTVTGAFNASVVEKIAVSSLLKLLDERRRMHLSHKRARIRARAEKVGR